jgi:hypothetical protein
MYMVGMALALVALAWELSHDKISISFGRRVAEIALAGVTVLVFWNYEAWIVNRNVDHAATGGRFDAQYLTTHLSRNATPALIRRLREMPLPQRDTVVAIMACKPLPAERRWFEWNRNVAAARKALSEWNRPACARPATRRIAEEVPTP